jgi:hypothetical protein
MAKPQHFAEMSIDREFPPRRSCRRFSLGVSVEPDIASEGSFFDPPMNACFLESLQRRDLGMGQARLRLALWESPAPATSLPDAPRPNQEKLDVAIAYAVTNRSRLFAVPQFLQLRESNEIRGRLSYCSRKPDIRRAPNLRTS